LPLVAPYLETGLEEKLHTTLEALRTFERYILGVAGHADHAQGLAGSFELLRLE
jgi:hypothetical protein